MCVWYISGEAHPRLQPAGLSKGDQRACPKGIVISRWPAKICDAKAHPENYCAIVLMNLSNSLMMSFVEVIMAGMVSSWPTCGKESLEE